MYEASDDSLIFRFHDATHVTILERLEKTTKVWKRSRVLKKEGADGKLRAIAECAPADDIHMDKRHIDVRIETGRRTGMNDSLEQGCTSMSLRYQCISAYTAWGSA